MQSDPIGLTGGINTYIYSQASPIKYVDALGLYKVSPILELMYPKSAQAIKNYINNVSSNEISGWKSQCGPGVSNSDINGVLTDGSGAGVMFGDLLDPNINVVPAFASYDPQTNIITLDASILESYENGTLKNGFLEATLGHETAHAIDIAADGINQVNNQGAAIEEGAAWEVQVYGSLQYP